MGRPLTTLMGLRVGRLVVIGRAVSGPGRSYWHCLCDCGTTKDVAASCLKKATTQSCGCLNSELSAARNSIGKRTHGLGDSRLYRIWIGMRRRCYSPAMQSYKYYGARGITVCDEWIKPEPFLEWALANGYRDDLQIDRIDPDGNYEPTNCRWVTPKENANNRRSHVAKEKA